MLENDNDRVKVLSVPHSLNKSTSMIGDCDIEVTNTRLRKGWSAEDPMEIGFGDDTWDLPAKHSEKLNRSFTPSTTVGASDRRSIKLETQRPIAPSSCPKPACAVVDLTMLPSSESSDSTSDDDSDDESTDDIIYVGESGGRESQLEGAYGQRLIAKSTTTRLGDHENDCIDSDDESQIREHENNATATTSREPSSTEAETKLQRATQTTTSLHASSHSPPDSEDERQAADVSDMGPDEGDFEIPELEMFNSHDVPLPFTREREEALAKERIESARQVHEAANH